MPPAASGPVFTVSKPIFIGALCATAGIGKAPALDRAAAPATNLRRLIRRIMAFSRAFRPWSGHIVGLAHAGAEAPRSAGRYSIIQGSEAKLRGAGPRLPTDALGRVKCARPRPVDRTPKTPGACGRDCRPRRPASHD